MQGLSLDVAACTGSGHGDMSFESSLILLPGNVNIVCGFTNQSRHEGKCDGNHKVAQVWLEFCPQAEGTPIVAVATCAGGRLTCSDSLRDVYDEI